MQNRFARQVTDLSVRDQEVAKSVIATARLSFSGLTAARGSDYYQAPGLSPQETYIRVAEEVGRVMALCAIEGARDRDLSVEAIELIHDAMFRPVFGGATTKMRTAKDAREDAVQYPIVIGRRSDPHIKTQSGSGGRQVRANVARALKKFHRDVECLAAMEQPSLRDAALPAVRLYARIISIHPFFDGNGRTAMGVLAYALQRVGLVHVSVPVTDETRWALGRALRRDGRQSYRPLVEIVVGAVSAR